MNGRYRAAVTEQRQELRRRFHQQLDDIDAKVIRLFALVTESVAAATDTLLAGDTEAARELTEQDSLVDQLEADLEQVAERELLMQTPMAGDMRYLVSVLRVVPELERSGDLAEHIAQRAVTGLALRLTPVGAGPASSRWAASASTCGARPPTPGSSGTARPPPSSTGRRPARRAARRSGRRARRTPTSPWPTPCRRRWSPASTSASATTPCTSPNVSATSPTGS